MRRLLKAVDKKMAGFKTTGLEPWTCLLSPDRMDFCRVWRLLALKVIKQCLSGTSGVAHAAPTEASLLAPPLTDTLNVRYKLNGSSLGRPDVDT